MKKCAIYTRVSTDMQAEKEFNSCETQELKIKSFINSQENLSVYKVYSDPGFTGGNINRPGLQKILRDIQNNKIDLVISYKIDRLTRSPKDFYQMIELFDSYKVDFISVTERFDTSTPSGKLLRNLMLNFAAYERDLARERTKDKMVERAKAGLSNGGTTPYGYRKENKKLFIDEEQAKDIVLLFETYLDTGSLAKAYDSIKKHKTFSKGYIFDILRNPVYAGKIRYDGKIYNGIHEPIISEEMFNMAQEIHHKIEKKFKIYRNHLFSGILKCKNCALAMSPSFTNKHKDGKLKRYFYYRCITTYKFDWDKCPVKQVNGDKLEQFILDNLDRIYHDKQYLENLIFKLNHGSALGNREGYEIPDPEIKFSGKNLKTALIEIIKIIKEPRRAERNLKIKKYIKEIKYSPEEIELKLFYKDSYDDIGNQKGKVSWRVGDPRFSEGNSEPAGAGLGSSKKVVNKNSGWKAGVGTTKRNRTVESCNFYENKMTSDDLIMNISVKIKPL